MNRPGASPLVILHAMALPQEGAVPEWLHLIPAGKTETVDGRASGHLAPDVVPQMFAVGGDRAARVPVDINHANAKRGGAGHETPAIGWIVELQSRDTGLWGRVEWNRRGRDALENREYRGISPEVFVRRSDGVILGIQGASLTNAPNLRGLTPLFNTQEQDNMEKLLEQLRAALGLKNDAGEDVVLNSIETLKTEAATRKGQLAALAKAAGQADDAGHEVVLNAVKAGAARAGDKGSAEKEIEGLRDELTKITVELNTVKAAGAREKAEAFVDGEIKRGRVGLKPSRDRFVQMHMADPANARAIIEGMPVMTGEMTAPAAAPKEGEVVLNSVDNRVASLLGIKTEDMKKIKTAEAAEVM